jgi:hypothetical protein
MQLMERKKPLNALPPNCVERQFMKGSYVFVTNIGDIKSKQAALL